MVTSVCPCPCRLAAAFWAESLVWPPAQDAQVAFEPAAELAWVQAVSLPLSGPAWAGSPESRVLIAEALPVLMFEVSV
jgi:hypothetical protein